MESIKNKDKEPPVSTDVKRFYTINIECHDVGCEILINDFPIFSTDYPTTLSHISINPWLVNGKNTFKIRSLLVDSATKKNPNFSYDDMSCKIIVWGPKENGMPEVMLDQAEIKPSESSPIVSKEGVFILSLGYASPVWAQSEKIGKDPTTQAKVLAKYKEFYHMLEQKDLEGLMKFSALKFKDYSKSMYNPDFESRMRTSFKDCFAGNNGNLIGIDAQEKNGLLYEYYYSDRLISIKNDDNRSIIMYYDNEQGVTTQYTLYFYFDGKDFVLIL